jgi:hypothetical protein
MQKIVWLLICTVLLLTPATLVAADAPPGWEEVSTGSASGGGISDHDSGSEAPLWQMRRYLTFRRNIRRSAPRRGFLFAANNGVNGRELWRTDATATLLIKYQKTAA